MNNVLYVISSILAVGAMVFFYLRAGNKLSEIGFWQLIQALMIWSVLAAVIYIVIEFIFV